jgi:hypothetical protein
MGLPTGQGSWAIASALAGGNVTPGSGTGTEPVRDQKDDYPWPKGTVNVISPLGFGYRECVDFVAWRINRDHARTSTPWKFTRSIWPAFPTANGDAIGWKGNWILKGWSWGSTPTAGSVGWYGSKAGVFGHVNYVQKVNTGSIIVEEYNWGGLHTYGSRTISTSGGDTYPDAFLSSPPV